ncbi:MAG: hypothetical protein JWO02_152, partial [Solirubrobacterales bacterium]|nr:hypothetical protein [Solirubrobacterales bacterium]
DPATPPADHTGDITIDIELPTATAPVPAG